jgi:hypothetical protein
MTRAFFNEQPLRLEAVSNGEYRYRWDIQTETATNEDGEEREQYSTNEVTVYAPLSANKIFEAVITSVYDNDREKKLINDYNAAALGYFDKEEAAEKKAAYKAFLDERKQLKKDVEDYWNESAR